MRDYEISLWTHDNNYLGLLRGEIEFNGEAYSAKFKKNVNGEETLSFSIPAYIFNKEIGEFEENHLWNYILNDAKIRLIKDKDKFDLNGNSLATTHDFIVKNYSLSRDGLAKIFEVECKSYAIYELGNIGYALKFSKEDLPDLRPSEKLNIDYWIKNTLLYTKNFHSNIIDVYNASYNYSVQDLARDSSTGTVSICIKEAINIPLTNASYWKVLQAGNNSTGWTYEIQSLSGDNKLYESTSDVGFLGATNWNNVEIYPKDKIVYYSFSNASYKNLIDNNSGYIPVGNTAYWEYIVDGRGYEPQSGQDVEKERILDIERSNVFNVIQDIAEKFNVWPEFKYTQDNGVITERKVILKETPEMDSQYSITYGVNLQNISRESNSDELYTKIIVDPIENDLEYTGSMHIAEAPQNLMMEDFIYNFDYYHDCGFISDDQLKYIKEQLPVYLRNYNLDIIKNQSLRLPYELKQNEVLAQIDFYNAAISGATSTIQEYNILAGNAASTGSITNTSFTVLTKNNGTVKYIDLSGRKGVIDNAAFKLFNSTGSAQSSKFRKIYDQDCPEFISSIEITDSAITDRARLSFFYNPKAYYTNASTFLSGAIGNYSTMMTKCIETNAAIGSNISYYTDLINKSIVEKKLLLDGFEHDFSLLIKEGNWKDTEYKIKTDSITIPNPTLTVIDQAITDDITKLNGAYLIGNGLPISNISFETIRVFKTTNDAFPTNNASNILLEYKSGVDYTLEYGHYNGNAALLVLPLNHSSFTTDVIPSVSYSSTFANTGNVSVQFGYFNNSSYQFTSATKVLSPNVTISKRSYRLDYYNILDSSLNIYPVAGDDPLVLNSDFTLDIKYNITNQNYYTDILFNPTRAAKPISTYSSITFDANNTSKFYYNDAIDVANRSSKPVVSYSIKTVDLSSLDGYENFIPSVGQKILINDKELHLTNEYGFLSEINYDLDNPENNELTISNYKSRFDDLFQRIAATSQEVRYREDTMNRIYQTIPESGEVNSLALQRAFDNNNFILSNSNKNEVTWGSEGITLTDVSGASPQGQVRLIGQGIFLSNSYYANGAREWRTGITGDGINANEITAGSINTGKITIWDETNPRFIWNPDGLFAYAETPDGYTNYSKYVKYNSDGLIAKNGDTVLFDINANTGNAYFAGQISANSLIIGDGYNQTFDNVITNAGGVKPGNGAYVDGNKQLLAINTYNGLTVFSSASNSATLGARVVLNSNGLFAYNGSGGNTFGLNSATGNAYFAGSIAASTINIPDAVTPIFQVFTNGTMRATAGSFTGTVTGSTISGSTITGGTINISSGRFNVNSSGDLYCARVDIGVDGIYVEGEATFDDTLWVKAYIQPDKDNSRNLGKSGYRMREIWAANGTIQTSDRDLKTEISEIEKGVDFILGLKPVQYKFIDNTSGRIHTGFIAQDVKAKMDELGIDFGGYIDPTLGSNGVVEPDANAGISYQKKALRYDEFIAPIVKTIQYQQQRINDLEQRIMILENK